LGVPLEERFVERPAVVRGNASAETIGNVGAGQPGVVAAQVAIGVGEHAEPVLAYALGQAEFDSIIATGCGDEVWWRARSTGARRRWSTIEEVPEAVESCGSALARVVNDEGFANAGVEDRGVFDHVI